MKLAPLQPRRHAITDIEKARALNAPWIRRPLGRLVTWLAAEILFKSYRIFISPFLHQAALLPGGCRFHPTCSMYGLGAIRQYGLIIGFMLFLKRAGKCHPWSAGGYDPLP